MRDKPNNEMASETMYSCGKQRDANPTHLSKSNYLLGI